jgi:hypothetical protein
MKIIVAEPVKVKQYTFDEILECGGIYNPIIKHIYDKSLSLIADQGYDVADTFSVLYDQYFVVLNKQVLFVNKKTKAIHIMSESSMTHYNQAGMFVKYKGKLTVSFESGVNCDTNF